MPEPFLQLQRVAVRDGRFSSGERAVAEESAIALTYDRASYAVMMATPSDLEDFAVGFSLSEGIVSDPCELLSIEIVPSTLGVEVRMELAASRSEIFARRRRHLAGAVGCGLCGIESLKEAMRPLPTVVRDLRLSAGDILAAVTQLTGLQTLNHKTRAVHAAAFWRRDAGLVTVREDVGRHNALDKLSGALARDKTSLDQGMVLISSRVSLEMVQKAAVLGIPILVALSAPTALAIRTAEQAGITLVAVARDDGFEVFTMNHRILRNSASHAA